MSQNLIPSRITGKKIINRKNQFYDVEKNIEKKKRIERKKRIQIKIQNCNNFKTI